MSRFEHTRYPPLAMADVYAKFFRYFQGGSTTDTDFMTKYQEFIDLFDHFNCDIGKDRALVRFELKTAKIPDTDAELVMKRPGSVLYKEYANKAQERFFATCFLRASNKTQYGPLLIGLENDFAQGTNQFPSTITGASNVKLTFKRQYDIKPDGPKSTSNGKPRTHQTEHEYDSDKENDPSIVCAHVDVEMMNTEVNASHSAVTLATFEDDVDEQYASTTFSLFDYAFTSPSSIEEQQDDELQPCPDSVEPFIALVQPSTSVSLTSEAAPSVPTVVLNNTHSRPVPTSWILLDTESTVNVFNNKKFVRNIHTVSERLRIYGTGGHLDVSQKAELPGFGLVWFHPDCIANILSFAEVEDRFIINYVQAQHAFFVKNTSGQSLKFDRIPPGRMYYLDTANAGSSKALAFPQPATHVPINLSSDDQALVERIDPVYRALGCPNPQSMAYLIRHKKISNLPFSVEEFLHYMSLLKGAHPDALAGHTTRSRPRKVRPIMSPLPQAILQKYKDVIICADLFFVPRLKFLCTVSDGLEFITGQAIPDKKLDTIFPNLEAVIHLYKLRGFNPTWLITDMEFQQLAGRLLQLGIRLNITAENEHVGKIERCIRTIKEDVRTIASSLPYNKYPTSLMREMVLFCIYVRNLITRRDGPGGHNPAFLIMGVASTYENSCRLPFGTLCYIKSNERPQNAVDRPRAVPAISLRPLGNLQGGYTFLHLHTWKVVARYTWRESVYTRELINLIVERAEEDRTTLTSDEVLDTENFVIRREDRSVITSWNDDDMNLLHTNIFGEVVLRHETDVLGVQDEIPPLMRQELSSSDDDASSEDPSTTETEPETETEEEQSEKDSHEEDEPNDEPYDDDDDDDHNEMGAGASTNSVNRNTTASRTERADEQRSTENVNNNSSADSSEAGAGMEDANNAEAGATDDETGANRSDIGASGSLFDDFRHGTQRERFPTIHTPAEVTEDNILPAEDSNKRPGTERYSLREQVEPTWKRQRVTCVQVEEESLKDLPCVPPVRCMRDTSGLWEIACTQMGAAQGLKLFGERAEQALIDEWVQLDNLNVYCGRKWYDLTREQRKRALRLVQLIKEKRCGKIKGRTCVDGRPQRAYISKEDATSPTAHVESLMLTCMIDACDDRCVGVVDIPGAFLHSKTDEDTHVIVDGVMVDMLLRSNPEYQQYVHVTKKGTKIVYLKLLKQMYGTVRAARLFYNGLTAHLKSYGFEANAYDPCVMNKMIQGSQCTIIWHVDDLKISHKQQVVVEEVIRHLETKYGALKPDIGPDQAYVGMNIHYPGDKTVRISMKSYIQSAIKDFPDTLGKTVTSPCSEHLFEVNPKAEQLPEERRIIFHTIVARLLFISTRARPDIYPTIAFLTSRCSCADVDDWKKLKRLLIYLRDTEDMELILKATSMNIIKWWVDAAYGVRHDYRSQTGACMSLGGGIFQVKSVKQNLNTKSSTEDEVVAASDMTPYLLWTKYFLEAQGIELNKCILYQDNESAILLEPNGRLSSGKRTKHINIRYFWLKDRIASGDMEVQHCGTDKMVADFFTKPLQGQKFIMFRNQIMGHADIPDDTISNQERVEIIG